MRSTTAEKARVSHPMVDGNPTRKNLEELVMATLAERGQDSSVQWDAYRDDDSWVVALRWQAGRSENSAHWEIHSSMRTTTLHPRDDAARELMDPARRPLRTIAEPFSAEPSMADVARRITDAAQATANLQPESFAPLDDASNNRVVPAPASRHPAGSRRALADRLEQEHMVEQTVLDERSGVQPPPPTKSGSGTAGPNTAGPKTAGPNTAVGARTGTDHSSGRGHRKGQRPVMPGWEDILLGGGHTPNL